MTDLAIKALRLHVAYEAVPRDRGGDNGPKGRAWAAFIEARDAALKPVEATGHDRASYFAGANAAFAEVADELGAAGLTAYSDHFQARISPTPAVTE